MPAVGAFIAAGFVGIGDFADFVTLVAADKMRTHPPPFYKIYKSGTILSARVEIFYSISLEEPLAGQLPGGSASR
jgi:hypothetical protein